MKIFIRLLLIGALITPTLVMAVMAIYNDPRSTAAVILMLMMAGPFVYELTRRAIQE